MYGGGDKRIREGGQRKEEGKSKKERVRSAHTKGLNERFKAFY